jgi:hypothetical protein
MTAARAPRVYLIGLDPPTARALRAGLEGALVRRLLPLPPGAPPCRPEPPPHLAVIGAGVRSLGAELMAVWASWGEDVLVATLRHGEPYAWLWRGNEPVAVVELRPGLLDGLLPPAAREAARA